VGFFTISALELSLQSFYLGYVISFIYVNFFVRFFCSRVFKL